MDDPCSPSTNTPRQKKRRRAACKTCNRRRVRCDATVIGIPCSNCKAAQADDCALIDSKRIRGPAGRFINPKCRSDVQADGSSTPPRFNHNQDHPLLTRDPQASKTARSPQFSLDLTRLCSNGAEDQSSPIVTGEPGEKPQEPANRRSEASFIGESWYASFLFRATERTDHKQLHQPIPHSEVIESDASTEISGQNNARENDVRPWPKDLPSNKLQNSLIQAYFSRFHPLFPILDRFSFLETLKNGTFSLTLLWCVLFVASVHCDAEVYHLMAHSSRVDAGDCLFNQAKLSFDTDTESDRITMLQCSYLLHFWWGKPSSFRDSLWWLATATRSAQCMGMHRSTKHSKMPERMKAHWKKIWWCLYVRDRQVSLALATPMIINDLDIDIEDLTPEDFTEESPETAQFLIAQASLSQAAAAIFFAYFSPSRLGLCADPNHRLLARQGIQNKLESWHASLPQIMRYEQVGKHHLAVSLQISYNFYMISFQQRLRRNMPYRSIASEASDTILTAANNITALVEDAMIYWSPEYFPMMCVTAIFSAMTAQFAESLSPDPMKSQLLLQKLKPNLLGLKQFEECYILARWIRNLFTDIIERTKKIGKGVNGGSCEQDGFTSLPRATSNAQSSNTAWQDSGLSETVEHYTSRTMEVDNDNSVHPDHALYHLFSLDEPSQWGGYPVGDMPDLFDFSGTPGLELGGLQAQSMQFLADLGLAGFREEP